MGVGRGTVHALAAGSACTDMLQRAVAGTYRQCPPMRARAGRQTEKSEYTASDRLKPRRGRGAERRGD